VAHIDQSNGRRERIDHRCDLRLSLVVDVTPALTFALSIARVANRITREEGSSIRARDATGALANNSSALLTPKVRPIRPQCQPAANRQINRARMRARLRLRFAAGFALSMRPALRAFADGGVL